MTEFEREFFKKQKFAEEEIKRFLESTRHDLEIAQKDPFPEVRFTYRFQALIKAALPLSPRWGRSRCVASPAITPKSLKK